MKKLLSEIRSGDHILYLTGLLHAILAVIFILLIGIDERTVHHEDIWLKPFRFAVSILIFTWTYAWFSGFYTRKVIVSRLNMIIALCMILEMTLISMQAFRGVHSHFNFTTPFDAAVYAVMGGIIGFNAIIIGVLFILFLFFERGGGDYRNAILWGMLLFLIGNLAGFMLTLFPGEILVLKQIVDRVPVMGWAYELADLRFAHFLGLHAIQVLPLTNWLLKKCGLSLGFIHLVGGIYLALLFYILIAGSLTLAG